MKRGSLKHSRTVISSSEEDYDLYCMPCETYNVRLPAAGFCTDCEEFLCESCFNSHRKPKPLRHHILLDKETMPKSQQPSLFTGSSFTKPCPIHKNEMIESYCHDHKALLCNVCVTQKHTVPFCHVHYIPDISSQKLNSTEYQETLENIDDVTRRCQELLTDLRNKTDKSTSSLTDILKDVQSFRKEINQRLDELEREIKDEVNANMLQNRTILSQAETRSDDFIKALQKSSESMKQLNTSHQADQLFVELKSTKQLIGKEETKLLLLLSHDFREYHFNPNQAISRLLQKETTLGTLTDLSPLFQGDICVKTSKDKLTCWITGMTLLSSNKLVVADNHNSSIKIIKTDTRSITAQLKLDSKPFDVTSSASDQLAVTLPYDESIQIISVSSKKLKKAHMLKLDGQCWGISSYQDELIVSFHPIAKVQILDLRGYVLKSFSDSLCAENAFYTPKYVGANSNFIYASDGGNNTVFGFNREGEMISKDEGKGVPLGVAVLEDGSLLVSEANKSCIQQLRPDLTNGKVVLKDVSIPRAICWCNETSVLYIGCSPRKRDSDIHDSIKMYKMS